MAFIKLRNSSDVEFVLNMEYIISFAVMSSTNNDGSTDYEGKSFLSATNGTNYILDRISTELMKSHLDLLSITSSPLGSSG